MTGKEIYDMIGEKHTEYITSEKDDEKPPELALTVQQLHKLADYKTWKTANYNNITSLASGLIEGFNMESVYITKRGQRNEKV